MCFDNVISIYGHGLHFAVSVNFLIYHTKVYILHGIKSNNILFTSTKYSLNTPFLIYAPSTLFGRQHIITLLYPQRILQLYKLCPKIFPTL